MEEVTLDGSKDGKATVLLHRHGGKFYASSPACSHYGAPLKKGVTCGGGRGETPTVSCPLHDATFDLVTGKVVRGPSIDGIAVYKTHVEGGVVYADIPEKVLAESKHERVMRSMAQHDHKDTRVFVLVGGGPAALAAAETLRQEGFKGRIAMLTSEPHLPYDRPVLSKNPAAKVGNLLLRQHSFFEKYDIEVITNATVTKLDAARSELVYVKSGSTIPTAMKYQRVLVATGASPRKLTCPGHALSNVLTLRTPEDAAEITKHAAPGQRVVVVGGSFIGMEIASSLRKKGCEVTVVAMEAVPFERVLGAEVGGAFRRVLEVEGVDWCGGAKVKQFKGGPSGAVGAVELEGGRTIPADAVVLGAGVIPNTGFLEGVAVDKSGGIPVSQELNSRSAPNLYAAGDVCLFDTADGGAARIEHWDVATQQGRVAALNMLGFGEKFTTIPFFWSGLFGKNLRFVGDAPRPSDSVVIDGNVDEMKFAAYYVRAGAVIGVATVNRDPVAVACAELMRRGTMPSASELSDSGSDLVMSRLRALSAKA